VACFFGACRCFLVCALLFLVFCVGGGGGV